MQGYGRRGRAWQSPEGNLAATLLTPLPGPLPEDGPAAYGFAAALAVRDAAAASGAGPLSLKWPNDVLLSGRKLSGLLIELFADGERRALALGIGVNLAAAPQVDAYKTAALAEAGPAPAPAAFLSRLDAALTGWLSQWRAEGFAPLRTAWLAAAAGLGERAVARLPTETVEGVFEDLGPLGEMILRTPKGRRSVTAGDVFFPGPHA